MPKPASPKVSKHTGRPPAYDRDAIMEKVCKIISTSERGLSNICRTEPKPFPDLVTIYQWLDESPEFSKLYAQAKCKQAEFMEEQLLEIADNGTNDYVMRQRPDGSEYEAVDNDHIQRSKLRVDTRKWVMARLNARRYGDKTIIAGDAENPLKVQQEQLVANANELVKKLRGMK